MHIGGIYYHPTFLYESLWDLIVFIILIIILRKSKKVGIVFFTYIGLYSIGRFFIEGLRTDSLMLGSIRIAQLVSLCGILVWIGFLIFIKYRAKLELK
jgi:phosphatidylglycerol---prolipoprotein diacylglyceryl transferase